MTTLFHPPIKRSIEIAGHKTSISLEPLFWELLKQAAAAEGLPISALVARIDSERIVAPTPPGLAGAVRVWLIAWLASKLSPSNLGEEQPA
ncbi:ribbon-helix-helix domain-containing protein [Novosphingobium ginsenosidimutans]|uniref:Ribbon-helix-helix domain-containing protein n=1 Tax=Novosphingobium ginsenosidimutans TaxID=1176536 RepID=A0A5B8S3L2_9SPHN|nr:ribbon-helix-helix domain-containing protein [Novosphingobium ginsenosidimutans]QEA16116.1 ribbon-helix-helix domain-containing protein [Novosphingobium ginsenosidimutans]